MAIENGTKATIPKVDAGASASPGVVADEVIQGLKDAGACIIKNLYSQETIDKLEAEIKPHLSDAGNLTCKFIVPLLNPLSMLDNTEPYFVETEQTFRRMLSPPLG